MTESFAGMLLRHRGRTGLTQRQLAAQVGAGRRSVQEWESGVNHPDAQHLRALVRVLLTTGGLAPGNEVSEAEALWAAAMHEAARMRTSFDTTWFAGLLAAREHVADGADALDRTAPSILQATPEVATDRREEWSEAPDVLPFLGRTRELATLREWLEEERCRLIAVLGMGGIGKTMLAARLAHDAAPAFQRVHWRSLRNAPSIDEWLSEAIGFLSDQEVAPVVGESARLNVLLRILRERRCLLVLDNLETVLAPGLGVAGYREDYDGYGRLLRAVSEGNHQSCLVLTSREAPPELTTGSGRVVRALELGGLTLAEGRAFLEDKHLFGDELAWTTLIARCGGNGLALRIVGENIRQVFGGDIGAFFEGTGARTVFGGIRRLIDEQVSRSSTIEQHVLARLAIEREPVAVAKLLPDLGVGRGATLEALEALRRRSLVERSPPGAAFTLQSVILEYATDRLVEQIVDEIARGQPDQLQQQPLIYAGAKDYLRRSQERLIGQPVIEQLIIAHGAAGAERLLLDLLEHWRMSDRSVQRDGPGNVVNLLRVLRGHLRGLNLSGLTIRHAYLQEVEAQDTRLTGAHLAEAVLAESFNSPTSVALSSDGAYLAAGTSTGDVCLWRIADRTLLLTTRGHTGSVWGVALTGDGQLLASGSVDGTIKLWEASSGRVLATLHGNSSGVQAVALSEDGQLIASSDVDGSVRLWAVPSGQLLVELQGHTGTVFDVALSADGALVASGGVDGTVRLWSASDGQAVAALRGHTGTIYAVAMDADGHFLASAGEDGAIKLWDAPEGRLRATLQGHTGTVYTLALSANGQLLASGSADGTVRVWDAIYGRLVTTLESHGRGVLAVGLSGDGQLVAGACEDGTIRLWEATDGRLLAALRGNARGIRSVALSRNGQLMASGGVDGAARLWDAASGRLVATLNGHAASIWSVALSDSQLVASGSADGTLKLWEAPAGRLLATLQAHASGVYCVALSEDGQMVASGGFDGLVKLWHTISGELAATLRGHSRGVYAVALSADGHLVASASFDATVKLWERATGRLLATLDGHTGGVRAVALSADGRLVASGGFDGTVRLWEGPSGRPLATLLGHTSGVYGVALSANGQLVASASSDETLRLWAAPGGQPLASLQGHAGGVMSVALSAEGHLLASGGVDGAIKLWDTADRAYLRVLRPDRRYERMDITGLTGVTRAQREALLALGAVAADP